MHRTHYITCHLFDKRSIIWDFANLLNGNTRDFRLSLFRRTFFRLLGFRIEIVSGSAISIGRDSIAEHKQIKVYCL